MSTVDVVIPCYNYARYLRACVQSVLEQPGVEIRVLVIDDASTDDSEQVGLELAAADSRVEYRRHAVNQGHIATYNEGLIDWSSGDYVALLSADDLFVPGSLERAARIMDADLDIGMVYGRSFYFEQAADLPRKLGRQQGYTRWPGREWLENVCRGGTNVISSPEVVVRRSVQKRVGGYRPELPHAGDLDMWLRIAAVSDIAYVRGVPQAYYRVHRGSMSRTQYRDKILDLRQRKAVFDQLSERYRGLAADADIADLCGLASRALAREALWRACRAYDNDRVEEASADQLIEFAMVAWPQADSLPEYGALKRRQRLGPALCKRTQLFAAPALWRRIQAWLWWQRWQRCGIG